MKEAEHFFITSPALHGAGKFMYRKTVAANDAEYQTGLSHKIKHAIVNSRIIL
ncbi:MAG: hypothetical protein M0Q95_04670 [Porticoccaceae bacterium]|nr:hypothetical protein [Porticoccaceae bacterium]